MKIKLLDKSIPKPMRAHHDDAGIDLFAAAEMRIIPGEVVTVPLGVAVEIPWGMVGKLCIRSSIAKKRGLCMANGEGVIDAGYRGEVCALVANIGNTQQIIKRHERIAQLVVTPCDLSPIEVVRDLSDTTRGAGGFGSTGV